MGDPATASIEAQRLRDEARHRLDDAAACDDPARCDALLQESLGMLAEARRLRDQAGGQANPPSDRTEGFEP